MKKWKLYKFIYLKLFENYKENMLVFMNRIGMTSGTTKKEEKINMFLFKLFI